MFVMVEQRVNQTVSYGSTQHYLGETKGNNILLTDSLNSSENCAQGGVHDSIFMAFFKNDKIREMGNMPVTAMVKDEMGVGKKWVVTTM